MPTLVIVESPGKVKKIREYLGDGYVVEASVGHIRDLPNSKEEIPEAYRQEPWAKIGIHPETFNSIYVVMPDKEEVVRRLRASAKKCGAVLFAMDADREGEAIAWHVARVLKIERPQRIVFTEITKQAIRAAVAAPRDLDMDLVAAQETRRAIDRFVGYCVSPLLWGTIGKNPETGKVGSAGRVQSAALMMLTNRELARMTFVSAGYCTVRADTDTQPSFVVTATHMQDEAGNWVPLTKASDFGADGVLKAAGSRLLSAAEAQALSKRLDGAQARVHQTEKSEVRSKPAPPFITSTLQQAAPKVKLNAKGIMEIAQKLYEGGYITYMRTDSPSLSDEALLAARSEVQRLYGAAALPEQPRQYAAKSKNAQEAHEAIRPSGSTFRPPETLDLSGDELAVYRLIYLRTVASQMLDTRYEKTVVLLAAADAMLHAQGRVLTFAGHTRLMADEPASGGDEEQTLPDLAAGMTMGLTCRKVEQKDTQPPNRYSDTSLIKALETSGIGRPSTYAQTIDSLYKRGYIRNLGKERLAVTAFGLLVITYLNRQIPDIIAREFTASMEKGLDEIAQGKSTRKAFLTRFYTQGLMPLIEQAAKTAPTLPLPHLEDVTLCPGPSGPFLRIGTVEIPFPEHAVPGELRSSDILPLVTGSYDGRAIARPPKAEASGEDKAAKKSGRSTRSKKSSAQ